jgi:hypothetical protein
VDLTRLAVAVGLTILVSLPLGVTIWALLDAARRPQWAWALAGRSQVIWMAWILFASLTLVLGIFVSSWYLMKVRPLIAAAEEGRVPP